MNFKNLSLTKKIAACIFVVVALIAHFNGRSVLGLIVTIAVVYIITVLIKAPITEHQYIEESKTDYHERMQEQMDQDYMAQLENDRVNEENRLNQEALDWHNRH